MRIVVHGQQAFGKAVLEALIKRGENVIAAYVAPEKPGQKADPLKEAALAAMLEAVDLVKAGKAPRIKQDAAKATYEGRCGPDNAHIDWGRPWQDIDRLIRGCNPAPGAWSTLDGKTLKIFEAKPLPAKDPKG